VSVEYGLFDKLYTKLHSKHQNTDNLITVGNTITPKVGFQIMFFISTLLYVNNRKASVKKK